MHVMKITSKMLYGELRSALGPLMKQNGFKSERAGRLGWGRPAANGHLTVFFQCDKWGWDENWGSKFTLEFEITPPDPQTGSKFERIGYLLEGFEELDDLRIRNNHVIARLPGTLNDGVVTAPLDDGTEAVVIGERADPEKAVYGRDLWLNYYSMEDVRAWAAYFAGNLLRFVSIFENGTKSAEGKARERFNRMMSNVQKTQNLAEKARIFEGFIASEMDPMFREGAEEWLRHLNGVIHERSAAG